MTPKYLLLTLAPAPLWSSSWLAEESLSFEVEEEELFFSRRLIKKDRIENRSGKKRENRRKHG